MRSAGRESAFDQVLLTGGALLQHRQSRARRRGSSRGRCARPRRRSRSTPRRSSRRARRPARCPRSRASASSPAATISPSVSAKFCSKVASARNMNSNLKRRERLRTRSSNVARGNGRESGSRAIPAGGASDAEGGRERRRARGAGRSQRADEESAVETSARGTKKWTMMFFEQIEAQALVVRAPRTSRRVRCRSWRACCAPDWPLRRARWRRRSRPR